MFFFFLQLNLSVYVHKSVQFCWTRKNQMVETSLEDTLEKGEACVTTQDGAGQHDDAVRLDTLVDTGNFHHTRLSGFRFGTGGK
jgi:hypothetical protein